MKLSAYRPSPLSFDKSVFSSWKDFHINDNMVYSYRNNHFDKNSFPSDLHLHDYYELVVVTSGDIRYVCENVSYIPEPGDIIVIPPGKMHISLIATEETQYIRHVFYFYPDVFKLYGCETLTGFTENIDDEHFSFALSASNREKLLRLLEKLAEHVRSTEVNERALTVATILRIFYLFNQPSVMSRSDDSYLPDAIIEIQSYLDKHFTEISSISDVAAHFFYSREHMSRLFKKYLNTTVTEYIVKRRVSYSCQLMKMDVSLTEICFQVGFSSIPAFIRAFKQIMGMTPSQYRKQQL